MPLILQSLTNFTHAFQCLLYVFPVLQRSEVHTHSFVIQPSSIRQKLALLKRGITFGFVKLETK
jgi:hypothetical protein